MTRKKKMHHFRDHTDPYVTEYLVGFLPDVPGAFLHTETLHQGFLAWMNDKHHRNEAVTLVQFARAVRAVNPANSSRRRRKGRQCRGWGLWPSHERQKYLPVCME